MTSYFLWFFLQVIKGLVLILSETGSLQCCYLGTEPALFVAPPVNNSLKSFEEAEEKLSNLQKQIAAYTQNSKYFFIVYFLNYYILFWFWYCLIILWCVFFCFIGQSLAQLAPVHELSVTARVIGNKSDDIYKACRILIELEPSAPLNNVQVTINCQPPFKVEGATHFIVSLCK